MNLCENRNIKHFLETSEVETLHTCSFTHTSSFSHPSLCIDSYLYATSLLRNLIKFPMWNKVMFSPAFACTFPVLHTRKASYKEAPDSYKIKILVLNLVIVKWIMHQHAPIPLQSKISAQRNTIILITNLFHPPSQPPPPPPMDALSSAQ